MDKPSKMDLYVNKLEEKQREHYHRQRKEALRWSMLLKKIKEYLEDEVEPTDEQGEYDGYFISDICRGRSELAENLLNQIKTWENENVNK